MNFLIKKLKIYFFVFNLVAMANSAAKAARAQSSQRAALEAASKEDDSPPPTQSPQNTNRGKFEMKNSDDIKMEPDMDSSSGFSGGSGKNANNDGVNIKSEIKTESDSKGDSKSEPMDMDGVMVKCKEEPFSPSSSDNKANVKSELKMHFPEPIAPNVLDKKKKCCK